MKASTATLLVLVAMCYFPEGEAAEVSDESYACTLGRNLIGARGSGSAPFCDGSNSGFRPNNDMPMGYTNVFSNIYGQEDQSISTYETKTANYNDIAKCYLPDSKCVYAGDGSLMTTCWTGKKVLTCWASSNRFGTCEQMCHEPNRRIHNGEKNVLSFGPSHEPGFFHRTAGWQESSTPPVGMYNGMVVSTEIYNNVETYCWCDVPQLCFKLYKNMTLTGAGTYYPDNYNVSNPPYNSLNLTEAMIWCQNENTCSGFTRVRDGNKLLEYVARGQETLTESTTKDSMPVEHTWLKTCFNSYNCYADEVVPKAVLSSNYPSGFDVNNPSYDMSVRGEAERYCRSEPTCGGLTYLKSGTEERWEPRQGTTYTISDDPNIIGSIVKTCASEEKHCLSKGASNMKISKGNLFDASYGATWPYNKLSFEEAAQYCELHPECGGITGHKGAHGIYYYARSGNMLLKGSTDDVESWRKVC